MSTKTDMIRKAFFIALTVSILVNLTLALTIGESVHFINGQDPKAFYSLSYEEQAEWKKENMVSVTGFEYLKQTLSHPISSIPLLQSIIGAFLVLFFSCLLMARWINVKNDS